MKKPDETEDKRGISRRKFLGGVLTAAAYSAVPAWLGGRKVSAGKLSGLANALGSNSQPKVIHIDAAAGNATNSFTPHGALGTSIDILGYGDVDELYTKPIIDKCLTAGWGPMTYRQNTELQGTAWHWNPDGTWSDVKNKCGYFTGNAEPTKFLRHSYGYHLPHCGNTRNLGTLSGYSRITDGNKDSYWKSNPYLAKHFTGEDDSLHPQWVIIDLGDKQNVEVIRIDWANPFAKVYEIQYWTGTEDAMSKPTSAIWNAFPNGIINEGKGGSVTLKLCSTPIKARFIRILMTKSSETYDTHGNDDLRNSLGYAITEIYTGTFNGDGEIVDIIQHTPDQNQTATYCSSIDPWHSASDLDEHAGDQTGFDLFFTSGVTNNLPAIIPIALLYNSPENAAAEIAYLKKRGYPVSYVEMGEEPDGQYFIPEDYGALYLQFATAIHKLVPEAKLGGPVFTGVNEDILVWPDGHGRTSWLGRFIDYLKSHDRISDLAFVSFEHYPFEPCGVTWNSLYEEPELVSHILQVWKDDGVPDNVPMIITESNLSWNLDQSFVDIFGALWLAEYAGSFLTAGGSGLYYFQFFPEHLGRGCHGRGIFGMFDADRDHHIKQYTSQYFGARLINLEWVKPGNEIHKTYRAWSDIHDSAGKDILAVYAVQRPDDLWSLMIVNRDQENSYDVQIDFKGVELNAGKFFSGPVTIVTFGPDQYVWHSDNDIAKPDGPAKTYTVNSDAKTSFIIPRSSLTVIRGKIG